MEWWGRPHIHANLLILNMASHTDKTITCGICNTLRSPSDPLTQARLRSFSYLSYPTFTAFHCSIYSDQNSLFLCREMKLYSEERMSPASMFHFVATTYVLMILVFIASGQEEMYLYQKCVGPTSASNSTYQKNLNISLDLLSSLNNVPNGVLYHRELGGANDTANIIALCRGDLRQTACLRCLRFSATDLPKRCPFKQEAIVWYDNCMLRYSNRLLVLSPEPPEFSQGYNNDAPEANWFSQVVGDLLSRLQHQASLGDAQQKFAAGDAYIANRTKIYGLVQCSPDLLQLQCSNCLNQSFMLLAANVSKSQKLGGRVNGPSCNFRYDTYQFYDVASPPGTNVVPPAGQPITQPSRRRILIIVLSTLGFLTLVTCTYILVFLKRRKAKLRSKGHSDFLLDGAHGIKSTKSFQFDFETIQEATDNFNNNNKLGEGGFGAVYKGVLVQGKQIAVKRLAAQSGQGDNEFMNEVSLLVNLQHRNLVRLLGYCLEGSERLLIYEFVPNSSLDHFLTDSEKRSSLDWDTRYTIITGIAKGLLYLHEDSRLRVVHRDLKAGNILLDEEMCPKIADFGMARLFDANQTQGDTNRIAGTYGYMAPEYAMHGKFSVKSDVYSFGIILLEIISGQKNSHFCTGDISEDLTSSAWETWNDGRSTRFIDPTIIKCNKTDILRCIHIGLLCVQDTVSARPTMASVVLMLNSASLSLPLPSKPTYHSSVEYEMAIKSSSGSKAQSVNQVTISELVPR